MLTTLPSRSHPESITALRISKCRLAVGRACVAGASVYDSITDQSRLVAVDARTRNVMLLTYLSSSSFRQLNA
jgi:hypothetical protein